MKKLLLIAILMLALVITAVACTEPTTEPDTSADDVTTAETPTEAPSDEPDETPEPEVTTPDEPEETTLPEESETPEPDTKEPDTKEPEVTTEPEPETTVDPDAPVHMIDPDFINEQALSTGGQTFTSDIGSSEVMTEGSYKFVRLTTAGGDPYVTIINLNANLTLPQYMAVSYRTNSTAGGQFFMGSGSGWTGSGDSFDVDWVEGDWGLMIIDLAETGLTSLSDGLINYARFDFFKGPGEEGDYFDIEYVAFFNTPEAAQKYADERHFKVPPHTDETLVLGVRDGGPFSGAPDMKFGQRGQIGENFLKNVTIFDLATYSDGNVNTWSFKVWQWDTDYATTVAKEPKFAVTGENHPDNSTFSMDVPADCGIRGDIYYEIEYLSGSGAFTGWTAKDVVPGLETYVSGNLRTDSYAAAITVGVALPTHYENYAPDIQTWAVSGHKNTIQDSTDGMVQAGGVDYAALLHQGAIGLGEIDLSIYDKVVVYCGCDASQTTIDRYNANANNRIIISKVDTNNQNSPAEEDIIASVTYTLHGWAPEAVEIDLSEIDYNGPVYVTYDTLPGTFMLFSAIEFIGAEIDYPEPEAPAEPALTVDLSTVVAAGGAVYVTAWPEAGYADTPVVQMMNWGSHIDLGEMDLSQYSKVVVTYGSDASAVQGDVGTFMALTKNGAVENADSSDKTDAEIIAQATMSNAMGGWTSTRTVTIEFESDYVGHVYLAQDMKDTNGACIVTIEFYA